MMPVLLAAFLLGLVAGLRTFTAPALLWLVRHGGVWSIVLAIAVLLEYAADLHPKAPPRTRAAGSIARMLSGAFCGWQLAIAGNAPVIDGAVLGALGAIAGAYAGLTLRTRAAAAIGNVPAGIIEDVVAIAAGLLIVTHA
ncbi:MAG TPA: hypothetical protein VMF61_11020 [Candidatus Acidoferrales bacterium]|nr:hypothetical protein [Candidatus Acidoferrales bacterium]